MLNLFIGKPGSGKTEQIKNMIKNDVEHAKTVYLIVPEQSALDAEAEFTEFLPPKAQLHFEVLNFTRLANKVFRTYGGISYKYLTQGMKACLMWRTLSETKNFLSSKASCDDDSYIALMLAAAEELKLNGITPEMLVNAADDISPRLSDKIRDLATVTSVYEGLLKEGHSDPTDDVGKLAKMLTEHNFFDETTVYVDSFTDFTAQQTAVMTEIIRQADSVTVALSCDDGGISDNPPDSPQYKKIYKTASVLRGIARKLSVKYDEIYFDKILRCENDELKHLNKHLWSTAAETWDNEPEHISVREFSDPYSEAEFVASDICRRIREDGIKYGEIAVIARDVSSYSGIIDPIFDKFEIPYFMSKTTDVMTKPLIKMIFCALTVLRYGYRREDVLTYIKTGLAGITADESDELSLYSEKWNISGSGFYGELAWSMNPGGLKEEFSERETELLSRLNSVKDRLRIPLTTLGEELSAHPTVKEACRAMFEFLEALNVRARLSEIIDSDRAEGRASDAQETAQLWNVTVDALDRLAAICGSQRVNITEFSNLLALLLRETKVGTIPTSADPVTVGSASALRARGIKLAYLVGCGRGVFPATVSDNSFFSDDEKVELETSGIVLSAKSEEKISDELFYFSRAAALASSDVVFTYNLSTAASDSPRSPAIDNLIKLFPTLKIKKDIPLLDKMYCREEIRDLLPMLKDSPELYTAALDVIGDDPSLNVLLGDYPLVLGKCSVSEETAKSIFPQELKMTQSRLESFINCKFSYYCNYILGISPQKKVFNFADVGTFMHAILERVLKNDAPLEEVIDDYIRLICPREKLESARIAELFSKLRRTAELLVKELREEFSQSDFSPAFFEYKIGMSDDSSKLTFPLEDGGTISLSGIADRIDAYVKDGKAYLRIVDYKTGKKEFSLSDIADGINLQLLIYLFSVWKKPSDEMLRELNAEEISPAGILYFEARPPQISVESTEELTEAKLSEGENINRSGLFISDPEILRAMDKELNGRYIPVKLKKDGVSFASEKNLASLEKFGQLFGEVSNTVISLGNEIKSGAADAIPKTDFASKSRHPQCTYCDMYPICRRNRKDVSDTTDKEGEENG